MTLQTTDPKSEASAFGHALKAARMSRRMSQLDLAVAADVSSRHVSFLETGRASPSRDMVLQIAEALLLPLGARNRLMQAAGFTDAYPASPLDSAALEPFRAVLTEMMERHAPYPAIVCDRHWNVRDANAPARALLDPFKPQNGDFNLIATLTGDTRAAQLIENLPEMMREMQARLRLEVIDTPHDSVLRDLLGLLTQAIQRSPAPQSNVPRRPLVPVILNTSAGRLRFLTAVAHFGTNEDVTVRDLRIELFFPADAATRAALHGTPI